MADIKPDIKPEINGGPNVEHQQRDDNYQRGGGSGRRTSRFSNAPRGRGGPFIRHDGNAGFGSINSDEQMEHDDASSNRGRGGRMSRGGRGGFGPRDRDDGLRRFEDRVMDKLSTMAGSTVDIPAKEAGETKFSSRCRLYIGNFCDTTEEEVTEMLKKYGEVNEVFVNPEKMFAFVRLDYRVNAERAKRELDGTLRKNRPLKVRFAPVGAAIKVKNLTPWVTNELLEYSFSVFGDIERAHIVVDERGNSVLEGIVEFARKPMALNAMKRCTEGCFFITNSLRPVVVEPYDVIDDIDGFSEKSITRKPIEYLKSREIGPRFAAPNSFEYEYGSRWKNLFELFKQKEESLKRELKLEEEKLEAQMEYARFEHETEQLREQLRMREEDRERQKVEWKLKERQADDQKKMEEENIRRQAEEMHARMIHQEEDLRRRQKDNNMFVQNRMSNNHIMDLDRNGSNFEGNAPPPQMTQGRRGINGSNSSWSNH